MVRPDPAEKCQGRIRIETGPARAAVTSVENNSRSGSWGSACIRYPTEEGHPSAPSFDSQGGGQGISVVVFHSLGGMENSVRGNLSRYRFPGGLVRTEPALSRRKLAALFSAEWLMPALFFAGTNNTVTD